jgi:hypothetical protein
MLRPPSWRSWAINQNGTERNGSPPWISRTAISTLGPVSTPPTLPSSSLSDSIGFTSGVCPRSLSGPTKSGGHSSHYCKSSRVAIPPAKLRGPEFRPRHAVNWLWVHQGADIAKKSRLIERILNALATCRRRNESDDPASCFKVARSGQTIPSLFVLGYPILKSKSPDYSRPTL